MKTLYFVSILMASVLLIDTGCKKENTDPALQSTTFTVSNWTWDSNQALLYSNLTWDKITSDIVNEGTVLIYLQTTDGSWAPLPRTIALSGILYDYSQSQRYTYNVGRFSIIVQDDDLEQPNALGTWTMKIVALSNGQKMANPDVDWNDYSAVQKRFDIK